MQRATGDTKSMEKRSLEGGEDDQLERKMPFLASLWLYPSMDTHKRGKNFMETSINKSKELLKSMDCGHVSDISMTEVNKDLVASIKEKLEVISSLKSIFRILVKLLQANPKISRICVCIDCIELSVIDRNVSFTGSMEVGREIMHAAASSNLKQVSLELVGKSPLLIFDDADVDKAASLALLGIGEICVESSQNAIDSSLFKQWLHNLQSEIGILADGTLALRQVLIQAYHILSYVVPGIVFARGPAVTVLILLESEGETYAVLTEQARVPTGRIILELPAGMLDDDKGDFVGTAVEEETGIKFKLEDMFDLTAFLDSSIGCRFFPSPTVDYKRPTYEEVENLQALLPRECNICQMQIGKMASIGMDNLNA
ncbi:hypothetical protein HN51_071018 [Arachis hypogaea]